MKFVWSHLLAYRQDKLAEYINQKKSYRGVFYVKPDERNFNKKQKKVKAAKVAAAVRAKPAGRKQVAAKGRSVAVAAAPVAVQVPLTNAEKVKAEIKEEAEMWDDLQGIFPDEQDHRDFFCVEACYKLQRLLPETAQALSAQWKLQALNVDRPLPERVNAIIRWTLMPCIGYADVVKFIEDFEKKDRGKEKKLPVNIIEAALKGTQHLTKTTTTTTTVTTITTPHKALFFFCVRNLFYTTNSLSTNYPGMTRSDEPAAPLNYLLSPKFLASDRARIAIYSISSLLPYMQANAFTKIAKMLLTGKNRNLLKITAYKELIRLLASRPTQKHIEMILHEAKRIDVHRDVRIAIAHTAFEMLNQNSESSAVIAWQILEATVSVPNAEVQVALLGLSPASAPGVTVS